MAITTTVAASGDEATDEANLVAAATSVAAGGTIVIDGMLLINQTVNFAGKTDFVIRGASRRGHGIKFGPSGLIFFYASPTTWYSGNTDAPAGAVAVRLPKTTAIAEGDILYMRSMDQVPLVPPHLGTDRPQVVHYTRRVVDLYDNGTYYEVMLDRPLTFGCLVASGQEYAVLAKANYSRFTAEDLLLQRQQSGDPSPRAAAVDSTVWSIGNGCVDCEINNITADSVGRVSAAGKSCVWHDFTSTLEGESDGRYTVIVGWQADDVVFENARIDACGHAFTTNGASGGALGTWPNSATKTGRGGCPHFIVRGGKVSSRYTHALDTHAEGDHVLFDGVEVTLTSKRTNEGIFTEGKAGKGASSRSYGTTFRNCRFYGNAAYPNAVVGVESRGPLTVIENCDFENMFTAVNLSDTYAAGYTQPGSEQAVIRGSRFRNIQSNPIRLLELGAGVTASNDVIIENNQFLAGCCTSSFSNSNRALIQFQDDNGSGHIVRGNLMHPRDNLSCIDTHNRETTHITVSHNYGLELYTTNAGFTGLNAASFAEAYRLRNDPHLVLE